MKENFDSMSEAPSEKQLKVIGYIEWNLGVKFTGTTKHDAQKFISDHIENSKNARHDAMMRVYNARCNREIKDFIHKFRDTFQPRQSTADIRRQREEARQQRYEEYIEDASLAYVNDDDDGFGGFAADRAARRAMPYDEFCRWHDWGG